MDHDRLFKELLTTFFFEFIELFVPELAPHIERESIEFLDKEIFTDIATGERHEVDLLVKVRVRDKGEVFILIHVEVQGQPQSDFARRMFKYFARLYEEYGQRVYPIVLFTYDAPARPEPDLLQIDMPDGFNVLNFKFRTIQLNRLNWRDYLRNPNPVASALMTKMNFLPEERPKVKLECLRMLVTLKLDKARSTLISAFMENYLKLTSAEMVVYNREVEAIEPKEKEAVMQLTNEWIEQGKSEGVTQGVQKSVLRLAKRRFGEIPADVSKQIQHLPDAALDELLDTLMDLNGLDAVRSWLSAHHR